MAMYIEKVKIPEHMEKFIGQVRERKGFKTNAEVAEYLLPIAASRLNATITYANKKKKEAKPVKAKPAKKATKKAAPKGPLARKVASTAKAPKVRKAKGSAGPQALADLLPGGKVAEANIAKTAVLD